MTQSKIAVVTPYFQESIECLEQCHESVKFEGGIVDHFMIADGHPRPQLGHWPIKHIALPYSHADNGNTPRGVGSLLAQAEGYDFIAYLDADNWYHPGHLDGMIAHHQETKSDVITAFRTFHTETGDLLDVKEAAEERLKHVDTSCFLISRRAFPVTRLWGLMPRPLSPLCDRVLLGAIRHARYSISSTRQKSVAFRTQYSYHYEMAGLPVPANCKTGAEFKPGIDYLKSNKGIAECVDILGFWPYHYF